MPKTLRPKNLNIAQAVSSFFDALPPDDQARFLGAVAVILDIPLEGSIVTETWTLTRTKPRYATTSNEYII